MASTGILDVLFLLGFLCSSTVINGQRGIQGYPQQRIVPRPAVRPIMPRPAVRPIVPRPDKADHDHPVRTTVHRPNTADHDHPVGPTVDRLNAADHNHTVIGQTVTVGSPDAAVVSIGDLVEVDVLVADVLKSGLTTIFLPIVYIIVFAVGLPTNAMAIWVFLFRTKKKSPSAIYMANLALSDLLFVIWTPLKISYHINGNNWIYGEGLCKVMIGFFYGNMYCSILFIACLSVERYWGVTDPMSLKRNNKWQSGQVAVGISVSIWASIMYLSTIPLYLYQQTAKIAHYNITTCHDVTIIDNKYDPFPSIQYAFYYFLIMAGLAFLVPSIVIVVAYALLLRDPAMDKSRKDRRKSVFLVVTVLVTFLVCFLPSNVMLVIHYFLLKDGVEDNGYRIYFTSLCLASLNSCLDPIIYYYVSVDFRNHVKNTLRCRSPREVERMKQYQKAVPVAHDK